MNIEFCLTLTRNLTLTHRSSIKSKIKSKKLSARFIAIHLDLDAVYWDHKISDGLESRLQPVQAFEPPEGGTPTQPSFVEKLDRLGELLHGLRH